MEASRLPIAVAHGEGRAEFASGVDPQVVLRDGRVEQIGVPLELYNYPANRFVAGFIGAPQMNFLSGRATATGVVFNQGIEKPIELSADAHDSAVVVGVRPESIGVSLDGDGDAMTRRPGDLFGALGSAVQPGATGVVLTLDERMQYTCAY